MTPPEIRIYPHPGALAEGAAAELARRIAGAVAARGSCRLALAGGSTPEPVYRRLARGGLPDEPDWARVQVFWGDERCVPPDHIDSNFRMAQDALLRHVPVPAAHVHRIAGELDPAKAARRYAAELGEEPLDLVLLGMGGDGHVASLFPDTPELTSAAGRVVVTASPAPPPRRISLSLRAINEAEQVVFLVSGAAKADRLAEVLAQSGTAQATLPAARVAPRREVCWLVDAGAAARL